MKTLKYIIISLSLLATIGATKSCVDPFNVGDAFLEKAPGADVNIETVFSKAENARYFLWDAYRYLFYSCVYRTDMVNEGLTDTVHSILSWDDLARVYYPGSYNKAQESGWIQSRYGFLNRGVWEAVRACWIFIENVERVPDMDATEKARMAAEAKIIIASRYFDLLRHTGGLPIIDHAYGAAEEYNAPRALPRRVQNVS